VGGLYVRQKIQDMNDIALFFWVNPVMTFLPITLVTVSGIASIVASDRGSARYKYFLSSLGLAIIITVIFYFIRIDMTIREIEWRRVSTNAIDGAIESEMKVQGYANGLRYLVIASLGLIMGFVSLMIRRPTEQA
jgi:hypothetical protein